MHLWPFLIHGANLPHLSGWSVWSRPTWLDSHIHLTQKYILIKRLIVYIEWRACVHQNCPITICLNLICFNDLRHVFSFISLHTAESLSIFITAWLHMKGKETTGCAEQHKSDLMTLYVCVGFVVDFKSILTRPRRAFKRFSYLSALAKWTSGRKKAP